MALRALRAVFSVKWDAQYFISLKGTLNLHYDDDVRLVGRVI